MHSLILLLATIFNSSFCNVSSTEYHNTLVFNGVDNYVNIDVITYAITNPTISAEIRFKTSDSSQDSTNQLLSFHKADNSNILRIGTGANGGIFVMTGSGAEVQGSGYNDDQWHLLSIVTSTDGTVFAYIDGIASYQFNLTPINWSEATKCSIGQEYDPAGTSDHFTGSISEVRIWNKQLTIQEINSNLCQELSGQESDLIALYDFEDSCSTSILVDESPNGLDGTIYADPLLDWRVDNIICNNSIDDLISFSIVGDGPYDLLNDTSLLVKLKAHLVENNNFSYSDFLVHVGDIKKGSNPCDLIYYTNALDALNLSTKKVYLLIGDNEWNDCSDPKWSLSTWNSTFSNMNEKFKMSLNVNKQLGRVENISFLLNSVLFITINQVGGNIHNINEWVDRMSDNSSWVQENLLKYKNFARSSVIFAHAGPDIKIGDSTIGSQTFYDPFLTSIETFAKPVLYIQGNTHRWKEDYNYGGVNNLLRVVIDEDKLTDDLLQVVVNKDTDHPFYFDKEPFSNGLVGNPAIEIIDASTVSVEWKTEFPTSSIVRYGKQNDLLRYKQEDKAIKVDHNIIISNLVNSSEYQFEVGTRTARFVNSPRTIFNLPTQYTENADKKHLNIYPDSSTGFFILPQLDFMGNQFHIDIFNLKGALVLSEKNKLKIDVSNLKEGVYILKLYGATEKNSYEYRIIKN